jgi:hypothetical protein
MGCMLAAENLDQSSRQVCDRKAVLMISYQSLEAMVTHD